MFAFILLLFVAPRLVESREGLYISNSTNILFKPADSMNPQSLYYNENSRIVGVAIDVASEKIFWTDIGLANRGIYVADIGNGTLTGVSRIISNDLGECNGITVDYVSKHIYWTDATRKSIEVANYDGTYRRVLTIDGLQIPRGIVAAPNEGYLFWGDQGTDLIERSRLDGSDRTQIISANLVWPNHMVVSNGKLYFVDGSRHELISCNLDGSQRQEEDLSGYADEKPLFGLTHDGARFYISLWHQGQVLRYILGQETTSVLNGLGTEPLFGLAYFKTNIQSIGTASSQPCKDGNQGGCSHLCLPITATSKRCSCPSYGGLRMQSGGATCSEPTEALFYTLAGQGIVGFRDQSNSALSNDLDRYLVGRSTRPVAVAYDPVDQYAYWSDVHESTVHKAHFTGIRHTIFMSSVSHSIGVVDGLAMDHIHRRLYYTNMGEVKIYSNSHKWHKIEFIGLDGQGRKTIVEDLDKPRGLYLDLTNKHLYYTDWGVNPVVVKTELDGSNSMVLRVEGLHNPNSIAVIGNNVYVLDSHYKTRKPTNPSRNEMQGALYRMTNDGSSWTRVLDDLEIPFGMTVQNSQLYVSDWEKGLLKISNPSGSASDTTDDTQWIGKAPMGLYFSPISLNQDTSQACYSSSCDEICVVESTGNTECTCDTYTPLTASDSDQNTCETPRSFILVADYNAMKLVNLDSMHFHQSSEKPEPQVVVEGNSYFSNIVAMVFDQRENKMYYTDVNRGSIYTSVLGEEPELFYESGNVIDGIALDTNENRIVWTEIEDSSTGRGTLYYMDTGGNEASKTAVKRNLDRPRAVKVHQQQGKIYWTQWGNDNPGVRRCNYDGSDDEFVLSSSSVNRPNGLDIFVSSGKLLIGDATEPPTITECDLDGTGCQEIGFAGEGPQHVFSVEYINSDQILFSDWARKTVSLLDKTSGQIIDVVSDLMRPTNILLHSSVPSGNCPSGECSDQCHTFPGGYYCSCEEGRVLNTDGKTCYDSSAWIEVDEGRCGTCTSDTKVCAMPLSGNTPACECKPGYMPNGNRCTACAINTYKPHAGTGSCSDCPSGSSSVAGSTECTCGSTAWDWNTRSCQASKPGTCRPSSVTVPGHSCTTPCTRDSDCDAAKKCCSYDGCSGMQCLDPVDTPHGECVYNGRVHYIGQSFSPSACISCSCEADGTGPQNPLYGNAVCATMNCPELSCDESLRRTPTGECCPICVQCQDQPVEILNCPTDTQEITLPDDGYLSEYNFEVQAVDNCQNDRRIEIEGLPAPILYRSDITEVTVTAKIMTGNEYVQDTCTVRISVLDRTSPQAECPASSGRELARNQDRIKWIPEPPTITDNVCGKSNYSSCGYTLSGAPRDDMYGPGTYNLRYVVRDQSRNTAECSFNITYTRNENLNCDVPTVNNGRLSCQGTNTVMCQLECNPGYTTALLSEALARTCNNGDWSPAFPADLQQKGCAPTTPREILTKITITELPCPKYHPNIIALGLEQNIEDDHLGDSDVKVVVTTEGCDDSDTNDFTIDIWLSQEYTEGNREQTEEELLRIKSSITSSIQNGEMLDADGETLDGDIDSRQNDTKIGCPIGSLARDLDCVLCPVGTSYSTEEMTCKECAKDTYQDVTGRTYCKKCPELGITEEKGVATVELCLPAPTEKNPTIGDEDGSDFPIGIVVGVVVAVVIVLIVIAVIVVVLKKRRRGPAGDRCDKYKAGEEEDKEVKHDNNAFMDESIYEDPPNVEDKPPVYESLNEKKVPEEESPYTTVCTTPDK